METIAGWELKKSRDKTVTLLRFHSEGSAAEAPIGPVGVSTEHRPRALIGIAPSKKDVGGKKIIRRLNGLTIKGVKLTKCYPGRCRSPLAGKTACC